MSSSDQASNSSRQTSLAASSVSSYSPSTQRVQKPYRMPSSPNSDTSRGYVSPYPPLPSSSAAKPSAVIPGQRTTSANPTPPWQSAVSAMVAQVEEKEEVREYTFPLFKYEALTNKPGSMFDAASITEAQKQALIEALSEHRINTVGELRRVERIFATLGSSDLTQPMTAAWLYYVQSNSLLTELRALTRNYPFSSECLDEGKRRVYEDPASNRSWNYCWLVLAKVHTERLIPTHARAQAAKPAMWGGKTPDPAAVERLANAFIQEWSAALAQLLRYWENPPIRSSS